MQKNPASGIGALSILPLRKNQRFFSFAIRVIKWVNLNEPLILHIMRQIWIAIFALFLVGCSARKASTLYGVSMEGTPFDLMERFCKMRVCKMEILFVRFGKK
ncbi:MAG: hypothetical protein ACI4TV_02405 [Paludibacteraceae bacterium]